MRGDRKAVALRKESVDRNISGSMMVHGDLRVALRKESVDRNIGASYGRTAKMVSLSARRAWIEMSKSTCMQVALTVALRKESVDRNMLFANADCEKIVALRKESVDRNIFADASKISELVSLSARRAWIEMVAACPFSCCGAGRPPQGERG